MAAAVLAALIAPLAVAVGAETAQLVLVRTARWDAPAGTLTRWERVPGGRWRAVGRPIEVGVGAAGLGWGRGLHGAGGPGPVKREGDLRAPAGVFLLGEAFGFASRADPGVAWPYRPLTPRTVCVDDPAAAAYNQLVEAPLAGPLPWRSAERMREAGAAYRRGVFVLQNSPDRVPGAGSCVFLHVGPPRTPTVGCTAMAAADLAGLIAWLRPDAHPVLVQAPAPVYARNAAAWGAPP